MLKSLIINCMLWVYFTLGTIVLWTIVNIWDKYIVSRELRDPVLVSTATGFSICFMYLILGAIFGTVSISAQAIISAATAGFIYPVAMWLYYYVMEREEVSRFVPILAMEPFLIALVAFVFLGERVQVINYIGIASVIIGAIFISLKKYDSKVKTKHLFALAFVALAIFSLRSLLFKYASEQAPFWSTVFWFGAGGLIIPIIMFAIHHPRIRAKGKAGLKQSVFNALLSGTALILFIKAISLGPVTLVAGFVAVKPVMVLLAATFLSYFHSKIIREKHSPAILASKIVGTVLIVLGGIFVLM